jgi:hypothetical protein
VFSDQRDVEPVPAFGRTESQIAWAQRFFVTDATIHRARSRWRQWPAGVFTSYIQSDSAPGNRGNDEPFSDVGSTQSAERSSHEHELSDARIRGARTFARCSGRGTECPSTAGAECRLSHRVTAGVLERCAARRPAAGRPAASGPARPRGAAHQCRATSRRAPAASRASRHRTGTGYSASRSFRSAQIRRTSGGARTRSGAASGHGVVGRTPAERRRSARPAS